jgi:hypothetical protein
LNSNYISQTHHINKNPPLSTNTGKINIVGEPSQSLKDVLPYMATLPSIIAYPPSTRPSTCICSYRKATSRKFKSDGCYLIPPLMK